MIYIYLLFNISYIYVCTHTFTPPPTHTQIEKTTKQDQSFKMCVGIVAAKCQIS